MDLALSCTLLSARLGIGRTDLWGSSFPQLKHSVQTKLYTLPGETWIVPGHGGKTKIHLEAEWNPFVKAESGPNSKAGSKLVENISEALAGSRVKASTALKAELPHGCHCCEMLALGKDMLSRM